MPFTVIDFILFGGFLCAYTIYSLDYWESVDLSSDESSISLPPHFFAIL